MPHEFLAISHSWTNDMQLWMTPINHYQWSVPLPNGITFEKIRWEALHAGAQYCWLDVLCLRQRTTEYVDGVPRLVNELQRGEEWSIDIPTIGNIYRQASMVQRYLNGLGRELKLTGWDDPRYWTRRAWTLQETLAEHLMINACVPEDMPFPLREMVRVGNREVLMRNLLSPLAEMVAPAEKLKVCNIAAGSRRTFMEEYVRDKVKSQRQDTRSPPWHRRTIGAADSYALNVILRYLALLVCLVSALSELSRQGPLVKVLPVEACSHMQLILLPAVISLSPQPDRKSTIATVWRFMAILLLFWLLDLGRYGAKCVVDH